MTQNEIYQFMGNFSAVPKITIDPLPTGASQEDQLTHMIQSRNSKGILKTAESWEIYEDSTLQIGLRLSALGLDSKKINELILTSLQIDSLQPEKLQFAQKVIAELDCFPSKSKGGIV